MLSGKHDAKMSKVRSQMLNLTNVLAVLTTMINTGRGGCQKRLVDSDYKSEVDSPVKQPLCKKKEPSRKKGKYKTSDAWAPNMKHDYM